MQVLAPELGILHAYESAGLSAAQIEQVAQARPVPVQSLQPGTKQAEAQEATSVIGIILLFLMLTQYNTWILMGVMQEKASRVVEVLLATLRPIQLLGGKVLGIGLVAHGPGHAHRRRRARRWARRSAPTCCTAPRRCELLSQLLWLVLGYAFYCWVYAAAGSMAERQDQVQTLVLPLTSAHHPRLRARHHHGGAPATRASSSRCWPTCRPTAPFCMPVLVGLDQVAWWQFVTSVLISIAGTAVMALVRRRDLPPGRAAVRGEGAPA